VVKKVHQVMQALKFELALDKTFFLGYRFGSLGLIGLATKTIHNFIERISRLYEQGASFLRIGEYVKRWLSWCEAGL